MKLWQAILKGCRRRKKTTGTLFLQEADGRVSSCALGAAYEAVTGKVSWDASRAYERLGNTFPILNEQVRCPVRGCREPMMFHTLDCIITHLNDGHGWSRERIALELVRPYEEWSDPASSPDENDWPSAA
jgi:hypothetical protein